MALRYAYNTNGIALHSMRDAIALVADSGYDGIALTIDHTVLDPLSNGWEQRTEALGAELRRRNLGCVIETGAPFVLDGREKHQPNLLSPTREGRDIRLGFYERAFRIGAELGAEAVSFWSGARKPEVSEEQAWSWLREGTARVLELAERHGVPAAMEPEPEMMVRDLDAFARLAADFPTLRLELDLGHVMVTQEREPPAAILEFADRIGTFSIEDMKRGEHRHLAFGTGDMDIPACLDAIERIDFTGLVCLELSSDSGRADRMVPEALQWLHRCRPGYEAR